VIWRDLAQLGVFGRIGSLGKNARTRQLPQVFLPSVPKPFTKSPNLSAIIAGAGMGFHTV
jgi:hypothetical protein